jgi:regulator of RNase E activity RraA
VFGRTVRPGQLVIADKHGFLVIPREDESKLLEAARFMDSNECRTMIAAARNASGQTVKETLQAIDEACDKFDKNTHEKYGRKGEW